VPTVGIDTDDVVINAEEAVEVPPIVPIDINTPLVTNINKIPECNDNNRIRNAEDVKNNDRREIFQRIGQQEFEDVVFTPERKQKKFRNKVMNESESVTMLNGTDHLSSNLSTDHANTNKTMTTHSSLMQISFDDDFILKPDRDLETIQRDVEDKEKLLADLLDFDLSKYMTSSRIDKDNLSISNHMDTITCINCNIQSNNVVNEEESITNDENEIVEQSDHTGTESGDEDVSYRTELKRLEELGECRKTLLQNKLDETPPTGNNFIDIRKKPPTNQDELEHQFNGR